MPDNQELESVIPWLQDEPDWDEDGEWCGDCGEPIDECVCGDDEEDFLDER